MLDETKLFDFIKLIFTKGDQYKSVKNHNKKRHQFMLNRFFAIKFPANANALNLNGINPVAVVDGWAMVASRFKAVPGWIYTKTKKSENTAKSKTEYIPSDEAIKFFLEKNEIGKREFKELQKFAKADLYAQLQSIEKSMKVY
jgi:hypothetical protein